MSIVGRCLVSYWLVGIIGFSLVLVSLDGVNDWSLDGIIFVVVLIVCHTFVISNRHNNHYLRHRLHRRRIFASQAVSSGSSVGVGWSAVSALVWTDVDTTAMQRRSSQSYKYSKYWCCQKCQSRLNIIILRLSAAASAWFLKLLTWSFVENYLLNIYHFRQWTIFLLNCLLTDKIFSQPCSVLHL